MTVGELKKKLQGADDKQSVLIYYENDKSEALILDASDAKTQVGNGSRGKDGRPSFVVDPKGISKFFFINAVDDIAS